MREILFRGKRKDNGEWVEGDFCKPCNIVFTETGYDSVLEKDNVPVVNDYEVIPETVGQYTGRSIGGKKVFDGDILQNTTGIYVVCWDDRFLDWHTVNEKGVGCFNLNTLLTDTKRPCDVIGNIYDNSELLKGGVE